MGCSPEDLSEAMNDREKWRKRVRDIRARGTTLWWWWWWWYIYIYIYVYISCHAASTDFTDSLSLSVSVSVSVSLSLSIRPYHASLPAVHLGYIPYPYRSFIDRFSFDGQHLHVCVKRSIEESRLWVHPYFSSNVPYVLFILFGWFCRWEVSGRTAAVSWNVASRICSI